MSGVQELYPEERNKVMFLQGLLQREFGNRLATPELMRDFERRAIDEFAKIGFQVTVDTGTLDVNANTFELIVTPDITIESRIDPKDNAIDYDRMKFEHQQGFFDGVPGVVKPDGTKTEIVKKQF